MSDECCCENKITKYELLGLYFGFLLLVWLCWNNAIIKSLILNLLF